MTKPKAFTAVFLNVTSEEAGEITEHPKWSAGSWSHALDARDEYKHMFEDAVRSLAAIDEALGIDPGEAGGAAPILEAIAKLQTERASSALATEGGEADNRCPDCFGAGVYAKAAVLPEPPDVTCMRCNGRGVLPGNAAPQSQVDSKSAESDKQEAAAHPDNEAVDRFAAALKEKMAASRAKGRYGWQFSDPAYLSKLLREHVEKGDPRDVANFCMMLWHHQSAIAPLAHSAEQDRIDAERYAARYKWLREHHYTTLTDEQIDASIDAAIAKERT